MNSRNKPGVAFWATVVVVVVLVVYPLSAGPAEWARQRGWLSDVQTEATIWFYWPIDLLGDAFPGSVGKLLVWYYDLWNE